MMCEECFLKAEVTLCTQWPQRFSPKHASTTLTALQIFNASLHIHIIIVGKYRPFGSSDAEAPSPLVRAGCLFLPP